MKAMDSTPWLEHEHAAAEKTQQTATLSPSSSIQSPMALNTKTGLDQLTTSAAHTLAKADLSASQSPAQQPTNKSLPVELWMRIFEYVRTDDYARPAVAMACKRSLAIHGDTTQAAATLPAFEKRTWKLSRTFYHIDRASRAAALKLKLCLRTLQESKAPLHAMDHRQPLAELVNAGVYNKSHLCYVAIQVTEAQEAHRRDVQARTVVFLLLSGGYADVMVHSLDLGTAKHVVLLSRCDWDTPEMLARGREIEGAVYEFWRRNDIEAGVVEVV